MKELKVAELAAKAGARVIMKSYGKTFKIRHKGEINLVTEVDEAAQRIIIKTIKKYFPKDAILAEELDLSQTASAPRRWIIDPIDGTTNFAHGYPCFCVSIAFEQNGVVMAGVVLNPTLKETFTVVKGKGAKLNGKKIKVSQAKDLKKSLLVTGFPYDLNDPEKNNVPYFLHYLTRAQAIRRDGSAALDLCYVACGRFDGFWELGLSPWDVAAAVLLIQEAGGVVTDLTGAPYKLGCHHLVAANAEINRVLVEEARQVKT